MPEWDKSAIHDPNDGMYKIPEPSVAHPDFIEDSTGILIPRAKGKSVRIIDFAFSGAMYRLEVVETAEEILAAATEPVQDWVTFTDPVFETPLHVPAKALANVVAVIEAIKDMEAVKQQLDMAEAVKRQNAQQLEQARLASLSSKRRGGPLAIN